MWKKSEHIFFAIVNNSFLSLQYPSIHSSTQIFHLHSTNTNTTRKALFSLHHLLDLILFHFSSFLLYID